MIRKWTKSAGILFLAVSAVYSTRATLAQTVGADSAKKDAANVRLLDEAADPVPTTQPTTMPADKALKPAGQSVSASQVNVSDAGTVEIHVNDASLVEVLRMLSLQSQKNIIASKDVHGTVTANLYDVTVREALDAILKANGYDYREKGNFIFVYTAKEIADMEKAARAKKTEVFRLFYTPAANAVNMLKPVLSTEGQVAFTTPAVAGIGSNAGTTAGVGAAAALTDTGGNSHATEDVIVVTDYPENLDAARKVLKEIDRRPVQVLIEATILRATLSDNNALGIDFTALGGVDFSTLGGIVGAASSTGTTGSTGSTGSTGGTGTGSTGPQAGPGGFPNGLGNTYNNGILSTPGAGAMNNKGFVAGNVGGNGLQLGLVKDSVALFINALEGVTDTTVLANPKVLVLNKQVGEVHVGSELGYRTATVTETSTADTVNFLETGTRLVFRPYVGEGGYIRLEIHPEDSSGSVDSSGLPSKAVTQVTSNILVKDGHTIVIGGLFREATSRSRSQVPFLGSLPGVGLLFRNQTDSTVREEDIILLTPHIIKDDDAYSESSEEQAKEIDRIRVGMRRGLMPWGRERLAESWYQNAVNEMNKPHPDRNNALFNLNCAIYLNPKFVEAIDLRSQIQGHDAEAVDNSSIRYFVRDQILAERARGATTMPSEPSAVPITPSSKADEKLPQKAKPAMQEQADADDATGANSAPATQPSGTQTAKAPTTQPTDQPTAEAPVDPITDTPDPIDDSMPNNEDAMPNGDEQSPPEVQPQEQDENATPDQPKKDQGD